MYERFNFENPIAETNTLTLVENRNSFMDFTVINCIIQKELIKFFYMDIRGVFIKPNNHVFDYVKFYKYIFWYLMDLSDFFNFITSYC